MFAPETDQLHLAPKKREILVMLLFVLPILLLRQRRYVWLASQPRHAKRCDHNSSDTAQAGCTPRLWSRETALHDVRESIYELHWVDERIRNGARARELTVKLLEAGGRRLSEPFHV